MTCKLGKTTRQVRFMTIVAGPTLVLLAGIHAVLAGPPARATAAGKPYEKLSAPDWKSLERGGDWKNVGPTEIHQNDPDEPWKNNGFYRMIDQDTAITYAFDVQVPGDKGGSGMFIMGQDPYAVEHGDSYLVYFSAGTKMGSKKGALHIGKFVDNKPDTSWSPKFALPARVKQWVSVKIQYTPDTGEFIAWANGKRIGKASDKASVKKGDHVALHSFSTAAKFRKVRIQKR